MVEFGERNYNIVSIKHAEFNYKCIVMSPSSSCTHSTRLLINNIRLDIIIPDDPREKKTALCMDRLSDGAVSSVFPFISIFLLLCARLTDPD